MTNRRFSAPAGTYQCKSLSLRNIQIDISQNGFARIIAISHILQLNMALNFFQGYRSRSIFFRRFLHDFQKPFESGNTILELFHTIN